MADDNIAETEWDEVVLGSTDLKELTDDIDIATHNMWVDVRSKDREYGGYDPVNVEVIVRVSGNE